MAQTTTGIADKATSGNVTAAEFNTLLATIDGNSADAQARLAAIEAKGIEDGATADQTGAEIKALYEAQADTNAFTDAEKTKLGSALTSIGAAQTIGDGVATSIAVTHNLGTTDCVVQVFQVSDGAEVIADVTRTDANTVTLTFGTAPATDQYRVVCIEVK